MAWIKRTLAPVFLICVIRLILVETISADAHAILSSNSVLKNERNHNLAHNFTRFELFYPEHFSRRVQTNLSGIKIIRVGLGFRIRVHASDEFLNTHRTHRFLEHDVPNITKIQEEPGRIKMMSHSRQMEQMRYKNRDSENN